jgi:nicotinamidase-related amidase
VVDVFNDFAHEDGERLLESFRQRAPAMEHAITVARNKGVPVVYVNDDHHGWRTDFPALVESALDGKGGDVIAPLTPGGDEPTLVKHRYSAFDQTALELLLTSLEVERIVLVGAATEGCVVQTAIDARERRLKASIVVDACATVDAELEETSLRYAELVAGAFLIRLTPEGECERLELRVADEPERAAVRISDCAG